nr:hypothetical protein [Kofleriaceae bacterium]
MLDRSAQRSYTVNPDGASDLVVGGLSLATIVTLVVTPGLTALVAKRR